MKKLWDLLGKSDAWLAIFVIVTLFEIIGEQTIKGMFYSMIFLLGYFLSRIAEALEKKPE